MSLVLRVRAVHTILDLSHVQARPVIPKELPQVDPETGEFLMEKFWQDQDQELREIREEAMAYLLPYKKIGEHLCVLERRPKYLNKWDPTELGIHWSSVLDWPQCSPEEPRAVRIPLGLEVAWLRIPESLPLTTCSVCSNLLAPYRLPLYRKRCPACELLSQHAHQWSHLPSSSLRQGAVMELVRAVSQLQVSEMTPWLRQLTREQWEERTSWSWTAKSSSASTQAPR